MTKTFAARREMSACRTVELLLSVMIVAAGAMSAFRCAEMR